MKETASIRSRLILLVLAVALPLFVLVIYSTLIDVGDETLRAQKSSLTLAQATAAGIEQFVIDARRHLSAFASRPFPRSGTRGTDDPVFTDFVRMYPQYDDLFITDGRGKTLWDAKGILGDRLPPGASRNFYKKCVVDLSMAISDPFYDQPTSRWACALAYPCLGKRQNVVGTVCLLVNLQRFQDLMNGVDMPPSTTITVFDSNGIVIARTSDPGQWRGADLRGTAIADSVLSTVEGYFKSVDGSLCGYTTVKSVGWRVSVAVPTSVALDSLHHRIMRELFFGLFITLVAIGLAFFLIRAIQNPVRELQRVANLVSQSEFATRVEVEGPAEIATVSRTINSMLDRRAQFIEKLKESEIKFRTVFEHSVDAIGVSKKGVLVFVNPAYHALFGYENSDEMRSKPVIDLIAPGERMKLLDIVRRREKGEHLPTSYETRGMRKDGSEFDMSVHVSTYELDGETHTLAILRDITGRKRAERRLRQSERQLAEAERISNTGSWDYDVASDTARWSENMFRIFDVDPAVPTELVFEEFVERLVHPDDRTLILSVFRDAITGKRPYDLEYRIIKKDGSIRSVHAIAETLQDERGKAVRMIGVVEDITGRKQAEEEIKTSRGQLRALTAHLQNIREQERTLIAREIHDELGQALTGLKMHVSFLSDVVEEKLDVAVQGDLLEKLQRMANLIDTTIIAVRRISTELRPVILDSLGLSAAVEWQSDEFQNRTGIQCECSLPSGDITIDRDRSTALFRIFQEAMTNVSRHAQASRVVVNLEMEEGSVILTIKDDGIGIRDEALTRMGSLGILGMKERALAFGGTIEIVGVAGAGTTVRAIIPLLPEMS